MTPTLATGVLATGVLAGARRRGQTLAVAESLTGGLLLAELTAVPGASAVLRGGVVAYAVAVKQDLLGVPAEVLREHGAVSEQAARAMATGVARLLGSDWGVATTGVAGPDSSEGKPPGTVHVAVGGTGTGGEEGHGHRALTLHGTRTQIRDSTVREALELLDRTWSGG